MKPSKRFKELRQRLGELRKNLLPSKFSETGDYTDRQIDRARGYKLLAHAEIESYIEEMAKETILKAITDWKNLKKPSNIIISFISSFHSGWSTDDTDSNEQIIKLAKNRAKKPSNAAPEIIDLAQTQFIQTLKDNHGIKESNLKSLLSPIGIDIRDLDPTWIADINNFGSRRGDIAHNSKKTSAQINPKDEYQTVNNLLEGLLIIDQKIIEISQE